jgi:quercetin dioxygenase-like cupin family protein
MGGRLLPLGAMSAFPLPAGGTLRVVNPEDHGLGAIVVTTSEHPPGEAVPSHKHPCGEIFVVTGGRGRFTVEEDTIVADVGDMVLVSPETWHGFEADGDEDLRLVSAFDGPAMDTTFPEGSSLAALNPPGDP